MRKLLLASAAVLALSGSAYADNVATTIQFGITNGSTTTQDGYTLNQATLNQTGVLNTGTAWQGTNSAGALNLSLMTQGGTQNSATVGQVGDANGSAITQDSLAAFGLAAQNNAAVGQLGLLNGSTIVQTQH